MWRHFILLSLVFCMLGTVNAQPGDSLIFSGQASAWLNYNFNQEVPLYSGVRYIPGLNWQSADREHMFDAEVSVNINGAFGIRPFDSITSSGNFKPYRVWLRYSTSQLELRLGLQKINFGSASVLRPLMWFDKLDPRDPLQLTDGVWGILGRYYFLNNANFWLWVLYPSDNPKTWEFARSNRDIPEMGGRLQYPVPKGEIGLSFHRRVADTRDNNYNLPAFGKVPEIRLGLDGKWDLGAGLWFEATQTSFSRNLNERSHQTLLIVGTDFTFGLGNGLNLILENLLFASGRKMFCYSSPVVFSGLSAAYPLSLFDRLNTIIYYDWRGETAYSFISYIRHFKKLDFHLMAYWNPETYLMPGQSEQSRLFAGKGIQCMLVFNH